MENFFFNFVERTMLNQPDCLMKKTIRITAIVLAVLLVSMIVLPFAFKDKIKSAVMKQAELRLNARFDFQDVGVNLFQDFPNIHASVEGLTVVGVDSFATDTLLKAAEIGVSIQLKSLFTDTGFRLTKISIQDADLKIKVLESGLANYDIMKPDTTQEQQADSQTDTTAMIFDVDRIELENVRLEYDDRSLDVYAACKQMNAMLKGQFSSAFTTLRSTLSMDELTYTQFGMPLLSKVKLDADIEADADLNKFIFTLRDNQFRLNDMMLALAGTFAMPDEGMRFDLKLSTPSVTFKQFLSLVPAFYTNDFKSLQADGKMQLEASLKGLMNDSVWPGFNVDLRVSDGQIRYPELPKSIQDIQIALLVQNPGGSLNNTVVDLSRFHFNMGGNPFDLKARVSNVIDDPKFQAGLKGKLDLGMVKDVYPLPNEMKLSGVIQMLADAAGSMSYVDQGRYEKLKVAGSLGVQNVVVKQADVPDVSVSTGSMRFTPQQATISNLQLKFGDNDLKADGVVGNYLAWFFHDQVLNGSLSLYSNRLDLNELMPKTETAKETAAETEQMTAFQIPDNIRFKLNAIGNTVTYGNIVLNNAKADLSLAKSRLNIEQLSANALGGRIVMNGFYETLNADKPVASFEMDLKEVSYNQTVKTFDFLKKMAPIFEKLSGDYSVKMDFSTTFDGHLNPNLNDISGAGLLKSANVGMKGIRVLDVIASTLKMDAFKQPTIRDLATTFSIKDGKITTKPFRVDISGIGLTLGGVTGFDKSIKYDLMVHLPKQLSFVGANELKGTIGGTFDQPKVQLNTIEVAQKAAKDLVDKTLVKAIGTNLSETKAKIQESIDFQAKKIREQAKSAGDRLISEAEKKGAELVEKAKNPLLKAAAKTTAAQLVKEAQKKATQLMSDAENQIKKMAAEAQAKAE